MDSLLAIIKQITDLVKPAVNKAIEVVEELTEKIKTIATDTVTKIEDQANKLIADELNKIDDLVNEAKESGVDAGYCVVGLKENMNDIVQQILNNTKECIEIKLEAANVILNGTVNLVKDVMGEIEKLKAESEACETATCYLGLIIKGKKLILTLPLKITEAVIVAKTKIVNIEAALGKCLINSKFELVQQIGSTVAAVVECITNIF